MMIRKSFCSMIKLVLILVLSMIYSPFQAQEKANDSASGQAANTDYQIVGAKKINPTTVEISFSNSQKMLLDFYGDHIFRLFQDNSGKEMRAPEAEHEAQILVDNPKRELAELNIKITESELTVTTKKVKLIFDKETSLFKVINQKTGKEVLRETALPVFEEKQVQLSLKENPDEYFYGGGVQNGRFSHKGKKISIENQNSWTDGGVASPTPFYWSSNGYGFMWYTFKQGSYDFGAKKEDTVQLAHNTDYLDVFFMIDKPVKAILNDFYQLTGNPILLPKFGFYEGHLNAYNRDYWKEDENGTLFEDGKRYKESQKDNGGTKESLNGEKDNYQFSARAVIDRYKDADMPLGWILPNDGYGAGYGQTETLDGNIQNLKEFGEYARKNGVEIGLWTQSDLHPVDSLSALLQRDIIKEVREAGVRVLKTDVAWVGPGYSFGLNGVTDVGEIMPKYGDDARPFIISIDGWAGTQRYAGIWSGDQTGGVWEYIRFHIPTYIGSGLSGQPNITSDVDGIFGGDKPIINIRDFQWKTFTPMELNMDGWGANPKYPQALGEPATSINRNYLKLKSALLPYAYSIAKEAVDGLPMIRPMFFETQNAFTQGKATQYQFMYGPSFLVAPIYKETKSDDKGNDLRHGIYLPEGTWIDYFSGEAYQGNRVINYFDSPIWKLPVLVKSGAIIPENKPNNNISEIDKGQRIFEIYPEGKSSFTLYNDDGFTQAYMQGEGVTTLIESEVGKRNTAEITIHPSEGNFKGFVKEKATEFKINVTQQPKKLRAKIGGKKVKLSGAKSLSEFENKENVYFYNAEPNLNQFATKGSPSENVQWTKNPQLLVKLKETDITKNPVYLKVKGFRFTPKNKERITSGELTTPNNVKVTDENAEPYSLKPSWNKVSNSDFYEVELNEVLYSIIKDTSFVFDGLTSETEYDFKIRAVNKTETSAWTDFRATTKDDPLQFAIRGITAKATAAHQGGNEIGNLFDFDESSTWHTKWDTTATPFEVVIDLNTINQLDKLEYLPRISGGNGNLLEGKIYFSNDKQDWSEAGNFSWKNNNQTKTFDFDTHPRVRYVKIKVDKGVGEFGSGRQLYIYKLAGTESYMPGDINHDRLIDRNDLTSYTNYTGLRKGDADFEGYVSRGDVNKNGLIDAYDISVVATQLDGGVTEENVGKVSGAVQLSTPKKTYKKDEVIEITVKGIDLKSVNAMSFALPYNASKYKFMGIESLNTGKMENLSNDRLHSDREKVLYPTFVNIGEQEALEGSSDLFIIKFKAKEKNNFNLKALKGFLVDKNLNTVKF